MIVPGQTTREEILLTLGAPDQVSPDGSQMIYSWEKIKAIVVGGYAATPLPQWSSLVITLDEHNVVVQREIQKKGVPAFW